MDVLVSPIRAMLFVAALATVGMAALPRASAQNAADRDEQLWAEITRIAEQSDLAAEPDPEVEITQRRILLEKLQLYSSLYPGGVRSVQVVQLELQTLFEICCLTGGNLAPLTERCRIYLQAANAPATGEEAAYWQIICRRASRDLVRGRHVGPPLSVADDAMRAEYQRHVMAYPDGRHAPRMNEVLFADARTRDDLPAMRAILERLSASFPKHMVTEHLAGVVRLRESVGKPFPIETIGAGGAVEVTSPSNGVGLIVVWSRQGAGVAAAREVETFRAEHSSVWVFGLNVDPDREIFRQSVARLQAEWPQHWHELGRAGPFCRQWGIRRIPTVIVIDRAGRLVGAYEGAGWREAAGSALGSEDGG